MKKSTCRTGGFPYACATMSKTLVLSLLLAGLSLATPLIASDPNTVGPYGAVMFTIEPGYNPIGITFVNQHVDAGLISASSGSVITTAAALNNIGSKLDSGTFYYLEITGRGDGEPSAYEGDRFELNVANTIAGANNTVTIDTAFAGNTIPGTLPDLSGTTYVIRPHVTIKQVFGTGEDAKLNGTNSQVTADKVYLYPQGSTSYITYWYARAGSIDQWRQGSTPSDTVRILPGSGVLVQRLLPSEAEIVVAGAIRTNHFAQPLATGLNFVSEGRPLDSSPSTRQMLDVSSTPWNGTNSITTADRIIKWNGTTWGDIYWYAKAGSINDWLNTSTGTTGRYKDSDIMGHAESFFIYRQQPAPEYFAPNINPEL